MDDETRAVALWRKQGEQQIVVFFVNTVLELHGGRAEDTEVSVDDVCRDTEAGLRVDKDLKIIQV